MACCFVFAADDLDQTFDIAVSRLAAQVQVHGIAIGEAHPATQPDAAALDADGLLHFVAVDIVRAM